VSPILGILIFVGTGLGGMIVGEVYESASIVARCIVRRTVRRLPLDIRAIRLEEWLAELDAMDGLHVLRLCRAFGYVAASIRLRERGERHDAASAAASAAAGSTGPEGRQEVMWKRAAERLGLEGEEVTRAIRDVRAVDAKHRAEPGRPSIGSSDLMQNESDDDFPRG
jgi:hypothetical protein